MKICVFGGAFNPVHIGHINMLSEFDKAINFDKIIIIPTACAPHKSSENFAPERDRKQMLRLAFKDFEKAEISDIEFKRQGKSYTCDTLDELEAKYKDAEFYLLVGDDQFFEFDKWYNYKKILSRVTLLVASRGEKDKNKYIEFAKKAGISNYVLSRFEPVEASSTEIRNMCDRGLDFSNLVTPEVKDYIDESGLYRTDAAKYKKILRSRLSDYRYSHSLNVAKAAVRLAKRYGVPFYKLYIAGLLHDITKETDLDTQYDLILKSGGTLTNLELDNHSVIHQMSGAAYCALELGINDREILLPIRYHTTGCANMTIGEKIIYVADFISDERDYPDVAKMRELAFKNLDDAILYSVKYTIMKLVSSDSLLHYDTLKCYNSILEGRLNGSN